VVFEAHQVLVPAQALDAHLEQAGARVRIRVDVRWILDDVAVDLDHFTRHRRDDVERSAVTVDPAERFPLRHLVACPRQVGAAELAEVPLAEIRKAERENIVRPRVTTCPYVGLAESKLVRWPRAHARLLLDSALTQRERHHASFGAFAAYVDLDLGADLRFG